MKDLSRLPFCRTAPDAPLTEGTLVLEGGAFRGVYTAGVCDVLLEHGIRFRNVAGISSGSLNGLNYMADVIGRTANVNIGCLDNKKFLGWRTLFRDRGFVGFRFLVEDAYELFPFDRGRVKDPERRFAIGVTDVKTGEEVYFERTNCSDLEKACVASSSLRGISRPVKLDGRTLLDGGYAESIPVSWAEALPEKRIVIVMTSPKDFTHTPHGKKHGLFSLLHPHFAETEADAANRYNALREKLREDERDGKVFVIAPAEFGSVGGFERDPEKLLALYEAGRADAERLLPALMDFLCG